MQRSPQGPCFSGATKHCKQAKKGLQIIHKNDHTALVSEGFAKPHDGTDMWYVLASTHQPEP